jgi:hypothetical protein
LIEMNFSARLRETKLTSAGYERPSYGLTFSSYIGKVFHTLVPGSEYLSDHAHHVLKLGVVHIHETLTTEYPEELIIEIVGYRLDKR